jgi:bla regulator protein BlaR1
MSVFALIDSVGWTLLHFLWQGALVAATTAVALRLLRNADPVHRYNLACAGLLACLLWPAAELYLRLNAGAAAGAPLRMADALLVRGAGGATGGVLAFLQHHLLWIVGFWALCALALTLRMALGLVWIRSSGQAHTSDARLQASVTRLALQFGVGRTVRLRVVDKLSSPLTAGWLRPLVLVPAALVSGMPHELLEALLAHEMAHVKRLDYLVNLGQNVVEILLFYHPAVWWISGRIRAEREQIADDIAARHTGEPRTLARALSELEKLQFSGPHLALAASGGDLVARVRRLLRPDSQALNWKAAIPILGLAAACLSMYVQASARPAIDAAAFAVRPPMLIFRSCAKPQYPAADIAASHEGTVTLGFEIDPRGRIMRSSVTESSGYASMDSAALNAIRMCSFQPAMQNGKPVTAATHVQYTWVLE